MQSKFLPFLLPVLLLVQACSNQNTPTRLFELKDLDTAPFNNELTFTEEFNPYTYRNFFNGGGVALGDINNDGLLDIYFTGNMVDNKMFLNKGNWVFEDVTEQCGLACPGVWSSGANFVDINGDGWLDLYVCKAGMPGGENRNNELFINKGPNAKGGAGLEFEEQSAAYGLDVTGLSIQSAFFDYDRDGDLDCYLLNNSLRSVGGFDLIQNQRNVYSENGNKFFENRDGKFVNVTQEAGIFSSAIGFGLGITLSDFNLDGWTDIYISNDFFEKDYLYINNKDKTFTELGEEYFECFSWGSMGADVADLDNDLMPDLMVTEMLPRSVGGKKTKALYESWKKHSLAASKGYYHQFPRNVLQRNMGPAGFLEIGRKADVEATNWSWSCLMQDYDNDGLKDIIVTNGVYKDLLDRDYLAFVANEANIKNDLDNKNAITKLVDAMPSQAVPNAAFKNMGDFNFEESSEQWGLGGDSFSNGFAYGDLDNDGDLDLVFNNVNMPSHIYENTSEKNNYNYLKVKLQGRSSNTQAIGAKIIVHACEQTFMTEKYPSRGFQSSVSNDVLFGLGTCSRIDSVLIIWPEGDYQVQTAVNINSTVEVNAPEQLQVAYPFGKSEARSILLYSDTLPFVHRQPRFNQFNRERLLMRMNAIDGPVFAQADLNADGRSDIFIGGGKGQASGLLISSGAEGWQEISEVFEADSRSEVTDALFFDCDNDGDQDLYVAHGGTSFSPYAVELNDLLYINEGNGQWTKKEDAFTFPEPIATGALAIADYNGDGLQDIFIGDRNSNVTYGLPGNGYILQNRGNQQFEVTIPAGFENMGMITDAAWMDVNQDQRLDLVVVGEWMPIRVFLNLENGFQEQNDLLPDTRGLWNTLLVYDFNNDGEDDIFVGNIGRNSAVSEQHRLYVNDFDGNNSVEQILAQEVEGKVYPSLDKDELMSQLPILKRKYIYFKDYAAATIEEMFEPSVLASSTVLTLDVTDSQLYLKRNGKFELQALPDEIQYSSVHKAFAKDLDQDGATDLLLGGNHYQVKPQFGREDASKGWLLKGQSQDGRLFESSAQSLNIKGQIRDMEQMNDQRIIIGVTNQPLKIYSFKNQKETIF
ncbi:MAG: VCBS repeat-containing protein [Saprospiraceae bacterium]|nr:VCBS repeat-containing protein [Saprospiraceae bacterium]